MPTRRVALGGAYLPTSGSAHGAALGAAALPSVGRSIALDAIRRVVDGRWSGLTSEVGVRFVAEATWNGLRPPLASTDAWTRGGPPDEELWRGVAPDERWAME